MEHKTSSSILFLPFRYRTDLHSNLRDEEARPLSSLIIWQNVNKSGEVNDHVRHTLEMLSKCIANNVPDEYLKIIAVSMSELIRFSYYFLYVVFLLLQNYTYFIGSLIHLHELQLEDGSFPLQSKPFFNTEAFTRELQHYLNGKNSKSSHK